MHRALIVEDDPDICRLLKLHLPDVDCRADVAGSGQRALGLANEHDYDIVVLDRGLPDLEGLDVCRRLREIASRYVPILMLTAKSTADDRVQGLDAGADDYLIKPFNMAELLARVNALLRRAEAQARDLDRTPGLDAAKPPLCFEDITIDPAKRQVRLADNDIALTAKEFDLLAFFAAHPGRVFSRTQLLDQVWGYGHDGYEHTVNSHINRLRSKIERNPAEPRYVLTVWGVGYKFNESL